MKYLCSDNIERDLFSPGSRVRHSATGLLGTIRNIEWCKRGVPSAIPYCVDWDNHNEAATKLGILGAIYSLHEPLESATTQEARP